MFPDYDYRRAFSIDNELRSFLAILVLPIAVCSLLFLLKVAFSNKNVVQVTPFLILQVIIIYSWTSILYLQIKVYLVAIDSAKPLASQNERDWVIYSFLY